MDLGARICTPRRPSCLVCPLQPDCAANAQGIEAGLPHARRLAPSGRSASASRSSPCARTVVCCCAAGLRRGCSAGMLEVPSTAWGDLLPPAKATLRSAPLKADWWQVPGTVVHTFTHFKLELVVYRALVCPRRHPDVLGRTRALPLGRPPRPIRVRPAERHAQGDRARPEGAVRGDRKVAAVPGRVMLR